MDRDSGQIWAGLVTGQLGEYMLHDGFLFCGSILCVPIRSLREKIVAEVHSGSCEGHDGRDKIVSVLEEKD